MKKIYLIVIIILISLNLYSNILTKEQRIFIESNPTDTITLITENPAGGFLKWSCAATLLLVADDATVIGMADDPLIVIAGLAVITSATAYCGYELFNKIRSYAISTPGADPRSMALPKVSPIDLPNTRVDNNQKTLLFRGMPIDHMHINDGMNGICNPLGGLMDPVNDISEGLSSWTYRIDVAFKYAITMRYKVTGTGIVLVAWIPITQLLPSPDLFGESEVYVVGLVKNAKVIYVSPNMSIDNLEKILVNVLKLF